MPDAADRTDATVALLTPPQRGGISVFLLGGPGAEAVLAAAFRPNHAVGPPGDGELKVGRLVDGERVVDEAVVARRGEAFEVNTHGGPAVAAAVMHLLVGLGATALPAPASAPEALPVAHRDGANPAIGRELLDALTDARGALAVRALAGQWSGGLSALPRRVASESPPATAADLRAAADRLPAMRRLLTPAEVVLAGPPNAGKSTLANALVGREVSLVSDRPGTTRDWVREEAALAGVAVFLTDTAGLWDAPAALDAEAVRRARDRIADADVICLLAPGSPPGAPPWLPDRPVVRVATFADCRRPAADADAAVSARTGAGLDRLAEAVVAGLGLAGFDPAAAAAFTERQAGLLTAAADALDAGNRPAAREALAALLAG